MSLRMTLRAMTGQRGLAPKAAIFMILTLSLVWSVLDHEGQGGGGGGGGNNEVSLG